jgi:hypothetical protein
MIRQPADRIDNRAIHPGLTFCVKARAGLKV